MIGKLIIFILTAALLGAALKLYYKKHYFFSGLLAVFAFLFFVWGFAPSLTDEQVFCWMSGFAFFCFAGYMVKIDRLSYAFIAFLVSVFACFCGLSGVQALLKTQLLWDVKDSLNNYANTLDKYETNVETMHQDLENKQSTLSNNLYSLEQSFSNNNAMLIAGIASNQVALNISQSNLLAQQKQLSDVEYLVRSIYSNSTTDIYVTGQTDNLLIITNANKSFTYIARLKYVPIVGSVELTVFDTATKFPIPQYPPNCFRNIMSGTMYQYNPNELTVQFHYVRDTRETDIYDHMPKLGKEMSLIPNSAKIEFIVPQ